MNAFAGEMESHFLMPRPNVGALMDIPTGRLEKGAKGESIINGGLSNLMGITGIGNSNKTLLLTYCILTVLIRFWGSSDGHFSDHENTMEFNRLADFLIRIAEYNDVSIDVIFETLPTVFPLIPATVMPGSKWFDQLKTIAKARVKKGVKGMIETPILDFRGKPIKMYPPHLCAVDSFSALTPDSTEISQDKGTAGSKDRNMEFATDHKAKHQMFQELSNLLPSSGIYAFTSAHLGDNLSFDPNATKEKKLAFMKADQKLKGVSSNYYFYTTTLWFVMRAVPLLNSDRVPAYPYGGNNKEKRDSELMELEAWTGRNKFGPSGIMIPIVISQAEGVMPSLTEFHYLKDHCDRFGIQGNSSDGDVQNYHLDLCPGVNLSRTKIRQKIEEEPMLRRALTITAEMRQIFKYWKTFPKEYHCTPKELYNGIIEQGYKWEDLLIGTRGWWTPDQYTHPLKFLSTVDLLKMRIGAYHPYWMEKK